MIRAAFSSSATRSGVHLVGVHDTHQHVEKKFPLPDIQTGQHAFIRRQNFWLASPPQLLALRSDGEFARATIGAVHGPLQETPGFEPVDDQADVVAIDAERLGKRLLADARHIVHEDQQGIFELHQFGVRQGFSDHR